MMTLELTTVAAARQAYRSMQETSTLNPSDFRDAVDEITGDLGALTMDDPLTINIFLDAAREAMIDAITVGVFSNL